MISVLREYSAKVKGIFDVLVIDECQDFSADWVEALLPLAKGDGRVTLLEDPEQVLYERQRFYSPDWPALESPVNFRSPRILVDFMNYFELTDTPIIAGSGVVGFDPGWHWYEDESNLLDETELALKELMSRGYLPENIVILTFRGAENSVFFSNRAPSGLNGVGIKRQIGYGVDGKLQYTEGKVLLETLYRFKGQAADAVILTEVDFDQLDERNRRKLFVALSRARLHAVLITSKRARDVLFEKLS